MKPNLRKAIGKKHMEIMEYNRKIFIYGLDDLDGSIKIKGCVRNGVDEARGGQVAGLVAIGAGHAAAAGGLHLQRQPVHAGVRAGRPAVGSRADERRRAHLGAFGRQLWHVCLHPHALHAGLPGHGAAHLCARLHPRRAGLRAAGHHRRGGAVFCHLSGQRRGHLHLAAEPLGHDGLHRLAGHRGQPLPLPQGLPGPGWQALRSALSGVLLPVRPAVRVRAVPHHHAGSELSGVHGRAHRLGRRGGHLHRPAGLPGHLAGLSPHQALALHPLSGHEVRFGRVTGTCR